MLHVKTRLFAEY